MLKNPVAKRRAIKSLVLYCTIFAFHERIKKKYSIVTFTTRLLPGTRIIRILQSSLCNAMLYNRSFHLHSFPMRSHKRERRYSHFCANLSVTQPNGFARFKLLMAGCGGTLLLVGSSVSPALSVGPHCWLPTMLS